MHPVDRVKTAVCRLLMAEMAEPHTHHDDELEFAKDELINACRDLTVHVDTLGRTD